MWEWVEIYAAPRLCVGGFPRRMHRKSHRKRGESVCGWLRVRQRLQLRGQRVCAPVCFAGGRGVSPVRALHRAEELSGQGGSSDRPLQREWKGLHVRSGLRTDTRFPAARSPCRSPGRGPGRSPRLSAAVVMTNPACVAGSRSPPAAADVDICCDVCTLMSANPTKKCF